MKMNEFLDIGDWVDNFEVEVEPINELYAVAKTNFETKSALDEMGPAKYKGVDVHDDDG
jgi:hypothetical protein